MHIYETRLSVWLPVNHWIEGNRFISAALISLTFTTKRIRLCNALDSRFMWFIRAFVAFQAVTSLSASSVSSFQFTLVTQMYSYKNCILCYFLRLISHSDDINSTEKVSKRAYHNLYLCNCTVYLSVAQKMFSQLLLSLIQTHKDVRTTANQLKVVLLNIHFRFLRSIGCEVM